MKLLSASIALLGLGTALAGTLGPIVMLLLQMRTRDTILKQPSIA